MRLRLNFYLVLGYEVCIMMCDHGRNGFDGGGVLRRLDADGGDGGGEDEGLEHYLSVLKSFIIISSYQFLIKSRLKYLTGFEQNNFTNYQIIS